MASLHVSLRMTSELVVRESDGQTLILVALYSGRHTHPFDVAVIEPPDED